LRKITANYEGLSKIFVIRGGTVNNEISIIERYDDSSRIIGEKDINQSILDNLDIQSMEPFDVLNSRNYHFIMVSFE
ncbi:MAG: hypothetical protein ACPG4W_02680, partial [Flavobacteriales bacterium]